MILNINCVKHVLDPKLKETFEEELGFNNIQTYYPIMDNYFKTYNFQDCHQNYVFNNIYNLDKLEINDDFLIGTLYDSQRKIYIKKQVFIKEKPILEPISYMMNKYRTINTNMCIPYSYKYSLKLFNKINLKNNSSYVDSFFAYLASKLVEQELLPGFPLCYGTFCGISDEYIHDISEEYNTIKNTNWFISNNKKLFEIDMDDDFESINDDYLESFKVKTFEDIENNIPNLNNLENKLNIDNNIELESLSIDDFFNNEDTDFELRSNTEKEYFVKLQNFPTQLLVMENLDGTLEDIIIEENKYLEYLDDKIDNNQENELLSKKKDYLLNWRKRIYQHKRYYKWKALLFQICFTLAFVQKKFSFTHNDLHCNNIMFLRTEQKYLYYKYKNNNFRIPTHGYIMKIIDFGRAIYKVNNIEYFSDVFKFEGEAGGQYSYPTSEQYKPYYKNYKQVKPNFSFDLSRLSTTIIEELYPNKINSKNNKLYNILLSWITDKYNKNVMRYDDFDLYKIIARRMTNAKPENYLNNSIINTFKIKNINNNEIIYKLI